MIFMEGKLHGNPVGYKQNTFKKTRIWCYVVNILPSIFTLKTHSSCYFEQLKMMAVKLCMLIHRYLKNNSVILNSQVDTNLYYLDCNNQLTPIVLKSLLFEMKT